MVLYNEIDPYAAQWLRNLSVNGLISPGEVDERSIKDLRAIDCIGRRRVHLFAGIAGWELALRLAGWPADRPCWTGSCPCQPYSAAGRGVGDADPRNLWPEMFRLVRECRTDVVFGEQVAGAIGHGWLDRVSADLEAEGYAVGAIVLGAHSVAAPHKRQRLFWVADAGTREKWGAVPGGGVAANPEKPDWRPHDQFGQRGRDFYWGPETAAFADGSTRRLEPGTLPLAHGVPAGVVRCGSYGNAIVPQVAAEFIRAFLESEGQNQAP